MGYAHAQNKKGNEMEHPEWFFMWATEKPYVTTICGWTKSDVISESEKNLGMTWRQIYARGGRVVRVKLEVRPTKHTPGKGRVGGDPA
jgi:hypothetical protein